MFFKDFIKNPQTAIALTFLTHIISGIDGVISKHVHLQHKRGESGHPYFRFLFPFINFHKIQKPEKVIMPIDNSYKESNEAS